MITAVVGAGGKTSLIKRYAMQYAAQGKKVFVTTSTHMMAEADMCVTDDADELIRELERTGLVMAGQPYQEKICALSAKTYEKVCCFADEVLVEADGSRHLPLKIPGEQEPVIYDNIDRILVVCGLHALGKKAGDVIHRFERYPHLLQDAYSQSKQEPFSRMRQEPCGHSKQVPFRLSADTVIQAEHIQFLVQKGYVEPLRRQYPEKQIEIRPNHDGSLYQRAAARLLQEEQDVSVLKPEWFQAKPELFICGAGHVAYELAALASVLDFRVCVMDDREPFACRERFPNAEEVICDTFDHLERYLRTDAYYAVLTRGHSYDFDCVKAILRSPYRYLGMIGSRKKVAATFERLREEGFGEEEIRTIHAPIGLAIQAQTPAEIAVSILAELIQEKNRGQHSSLSRELLESKESGVLCVLIEKNGSAPREVGSMMLVTRERIWDTIGGGSIEYAVIEDARAIDRVTVKSYQLDEGDSAQLGMICGGTAKILFVPV